MRYVLYNPCSGDGKCTEYAMSLKEADTSVIDVTELADYRDFFSQLTEKDEVLLCGGDGTINRFVNAVDGMDIAAPIYYYPAGTGNDFYLDVTGETSPAPILLNDYVRELPSVTVNGKSYKFINGIGYGIDGYCCEVGIKKREKNKPVNYTAIAIQGLLFHFKPVNAIVTVDGVEHHYKKVWLAPTMNGRRYGGGMMPTPAQERNSGKLSVMIFHGSGKLKTLMIFPTIFKGEHVKHDKYVEVLTGNEISVSFDVPTALQVDGETFLGVSEYSASAKVKAEAVR